MVGNAPVDASEQHNNARSVEKAVDNTLIDDVSIQIVDWGETSIIASIFCDSVYTENLILGNYHVDGSV